MIDVVLAIDIHKCERVESDLNYNYYRLPFSINLDEVGCDILCEEYEEGKLVKYYLGNYLREDFNRVLMLDVRKEGELNLTDFLNID